LRTTTIIHHKLHKTSPESWTATSTTTYFQLFWQCRVWSSHQHTPHLMYGMPYLSWPCNLLPLLWKAPNLVHPASCEPKTMQCNPFMSTPFPKPKSRGCPKNIWKLKDLIFLYPMAPVKLQRFLSFKVSEYTVWTPGHQHHHSALTVNCDQQYLTINFKSTKQISFWHSVLGLLISIWPFTFWITCFQVNVNNDLNP
jgi:hypothetical protein